CRAAFLRFGAAFLRFGAAFLRFVVAFFLFGAAFLFTTRFFAVVFLVAFFLVAIPNLHCSRIAHAEYKQRITNYQLFFNGKLTGKIEKKRRKIF
ncbi:MAG: hypothetical protein OEU51_05100, partial [Gammaproteobacteria bacterium]|nr:hypothetical protein [Gammaproteobacteria bacterium]